jgi:NADH-quinone oxidoreductase subunit C
MTEVDVADLLEKRMADKSVKCSIMEEKRVSIEVNADDIREGIDTLFQAYKPRFITLSAVDKGLDIELLYNFSVDDLVVTLRTAIPKEISQVETVTDIVPAAEFIEKEVSELFGINFKGHPRTTNLILPDDWPAENKPLRKPLAGSLLPQARIEVENLLSSGCAQGVLKSSTTKREKVGLPELPSMACANEGSIREFQDLVKHTGFDKRAGFDWERGKLRYR